MEAVIFDLDGVLCHTDHYHYRAWKALSDTLGIPFDETINQRLRGVSRMDSLNIILEKSNRLYTEVEKQKLAEQKNADYRRLLMQMTPNDLADGAEETLRELRRRGVALAIGSSSKNTPLILERLGIGHYFDCVIDGNQITRSKPNPEVFLRAAEALSLSPRQCLVVEDAAAGVEAAHRGGFPVAGIGDAVKESAADYLLAGLKDLLTIVKGNNE